MDRRQNDRRQADRRQADRRQADRRQNITTRILFNSLQGLHPYTVNHCKRVAVIVRVIGQNMGLSEDICEQYYQAALTHDVGKTNIPPEILDKPDKLDETEKGYMDNHPQRGANILRFNDAPELAITAALYHHEWWDGTGYPEGLKGTEIPLVARVVAVADVYDAERSPRAYKPAITDKNVLLAKIEEGSGTHFDPTIAKIMINLIKGDTFNDLYND